MTRARIVDAAPEAVWRLVSDPDRLPEWWPGVQRVEDVSPGAWTKVLVSPRGKTVRADYSLVEADGPRRLTWRQEVAESPFERVLSESLTDIEIDPSDLREEASADPVSTRVQLRVRMRLRGFARFGGLQIRRATRRQLEAALEGLDAALSRRAR